MAFNLKIGDSVILKQDRTKAVIKSTIGDRKFEIIDDNGFEYFVYASEILPLNLENEILKTIIVYNFKLSISDSRFNYCFSSILF